MSYIPVNPYQKLTQHQIFQLFWFDKMIIHSSNPDYDYLVNFHITESLIKYFNGIMSTMPQNEGNIRQSLLSYGIQDVDDADVKNILMLVQISLHARDIDAASFGDENIRPAVTYYIEWLNYFNYMYYTDYRYQAKPVIWNIQKKCDDYTIMQLERGAIMERYIDNEFKRYGIDMGFYYSPYNQAIGENSLGIEIKHDMKSSYTGNYYIECYETHFSGQQRFVPSGILKPSNTVFWLIGTMNEYYIVYEKDLQQEYYSMNRNRNGWQNGKKFSGCQSSRGFVIRKSRLQKMAVARSVGEFVHKYFLYQRMA